MTLKERVKEYVETVKWNVRNIYLKVRDTVRDGIAGAYGRFTKTTVGHYIHHYFLKWIGRGLRSKTFQGYWYLLPALILLVIFTFYPILNSFILSVLKNYLPWDASDPINPGPKFDGFTFEYFRVILKPSFQQAIKNTAVVVFISVPVAIVIALFIAVMLNSIPKLRSFFQTVFFLPYVTNTIAIGLVFSYMFNYRYGIVNKAIQFFGGKPIHWTDSGASYWTAMFVLLVYTIWNSLAFKILVFTAGLANIDKQYYDAARVDGASRWRIFTRITVPLLSPIIAYVTITSFIGGFKTYTSVVALYGETGQTAGGIDLRTIVFYIYEYIMDGQATTPGSLSQGAATSLILFAIILFFTLIQLYVSKKRVHY